MKRERKEHKRGSKKERKRRREETEKKKVHSQLCLLIVKSEKDKGNFKTICCFDTV
jgi:hypothetical protein